MTLSTSAIKKTRRKRIGRMYLAFSLFCLLFALIYEIFSHGVYSGFMLGAFVLPLLLGALPFLVLSGKIIRHINTPAYHMALITYTVGFLMQGILDIYGTTNQLMYIYWYFGTAMVILTVINIILRVTAKSVKRTTQHV